MSPLLTKAGKIPKIKINMILDYKFSNYLINYD